MEHGTETTHEGGRDPFIDFLRVVGVSIVVVGHYAVTTVFWEPGFIDGENALKHIDALHPVTWLVQVMPLLFFVGGFSNARALQSRTGYRSFLSDRMKRLLRPTLALFAVWIAIGLVLAAVDPPEPNVLVEAADVAALPVWFLGIYLAVVALAPVMLRLHRRFGWAVPAAMALGTAVVDFVQYPLGIESVGAINYGLVWLFAHQLGFFYADRSLVSPRQSVLFGSVGLAGLLVLTVWLDYPVSMVGVPGADRANTEPPSLALIALTLFLVGLALIIKSSMRLRSTGLLRRANRRVLTWYLWHVSALPIATLLLIPPGFPQPDIGSSTWWAWRPVWVITLVVGLTILVALFGRIEKHPHTGVDLPDTPILSIAAGLAVFSLAAGVLGFGVTGFADFGVATLLEFDLSVAQNVAHLAVGISLLLAIRTAREIGPTIGAAVLYLLVGIWTISTGEGPVAMDEAGGWLHAIAGAVTLLLVLGQTGARRAAAPSSKR